MTSDATTASLPTPHCFRAPSSSLCPSLLKRPLGFEQIVKAAMSDSQGQPLKDQGPPPIPSKLGGTLITTPGILSMFLVSKALLEELMKIMDTTTHKRTYPTPNIFLQYQKDQGPQKLILNKQGKSLGFT